jgi:O-antigen/teichoic acid export membrane protein
MSKFRLMLKGSAFRTAEAVIAIALGFITLPLFNRYLGADLYGLWVLISSATALMYIFDIGFASAVTQKIVYFVSQKNTQKVNSVISTALVIYSVLGALIALVTIGIAYLYHPDLKHLLSSSEFKLIVLLVGFSIALEFPCKAFAGIAAAHLRFDLISLYKIFFKVVAFIVIVTLLLNGFKLVSIAITGIVISILSSASFVLMGRYIYKEMEVSCNLVSKQTFDELFGFSVWAFLIDLNNALKSRIDIFFIGTFVSLASVVTYYAPVRLVDYSVELLYKMLGITLPTLASHAASGDGAQFRADLLLINRINTYAYILVAILFIFVGKSILFYWLGQDFNYEQAYQVLVILILGRLSTLAVDGYATSLYAKSKHKIMIYSGFFETTVTALFLYITLPVLNLGVVAAALSMAVPLAVSRLILLPFLCRSQLDINHYIRLVIMSFRPLLIVIPCGLLLLFLNPLSPEWSQKKFLVGIALALVVWLFMKVEMQVREKELLFRISMNVTKPMQKLFIRNK